MAHVPAKGKGNIGRPPNRNCIYCGRRKLYPEKEGSRWKYPRTGLCNDCYMRMDNTFNEIRRGRKPSKAKSLEKAFPLTILDTTNNVVVGTYKTKKKTQEAIDRYIKEKPRTVDILVINYPDYYDYTHYFDNIG